jgi:3-dehydroquinate dehydratase
MHNQPLDLLKNQNKLIKIFCSSPMSEDFFRTPGIKQSNVEGGVVTLFVDANHETIIANARHLSHSSVQVIDLSLKEIFIQNLKYNS